MGEKMQDLTRINKKLPVSKNEIVENLFFLNFFLIKKIFNKSCNNQT